MGTIKQGILGGFSGKVGTVIGSSWKGISYMRGRAQNVKNPRTERQMEQRSKFALTLDFLKPITPFVRTGFKAYASKQTAFNAAMSYIVKNAISGTYPNYAINFTNVLVSRGALETAKEPSAEVSAGFVHHQDPHRDQRQRSAHRPDDAVNLQCQQRRSRVQHGRCSTFRRANHSCHSRRLGWRHG